MIMGNLIRVFGQSNPLSWLFPIRLGVNYIVEPGAGDPPADPPSGDPPADPPAGDPPAGDPPPTDKFYSSYSEEVRNHPSVQKFKNGEDLAKGYVNLEKKISSKGVIVPGKDAKPEEITEYHKALGNVTKAEEIEIAKLPDDMDKRISMSDERLNSFKELAVKSHFNKDQIKALQEWNTQQQIDALTAYDTEMKVEKDKAETTLRKELGKNYEPSLAKVKQLIDVYGDDNLKSWLEKGEGNNPEVIKFLIKVSGKMGEDSLGAKGSGGLVMTPAQAKAKINEIRDDPKSSYNDGNHRLHEEAVKEMASLYKLANPE